MRAAFAKQVDGSFIAADPNAIKLTHAVKIGEGIVVEAKRMRCLAFHRKFFALLQLAFEAWEPDPEGVNASMGIEKNFEAFRRDVTIRAGHFTPVWDLNGKLRLDPKSIAFDQMDDLEFTDVYNDVLSVVWNDVLRHAHYESKAHVERVVAELLRF